MFFVVVTVTPSARYEYSILELFYMMHARDSLGPGGLAETCNTSSQKKKHTTELAPALNIVMVESRLN